MSRRKKISAAPTAASIRKNDKMTGRLLGMKDWMGPEGMYFESLLEKARKFAKLYSFSPVSTPILESYDLYKKSTRRSADNEFYAIDGEKSERMILRPEITQGLVRAYLENNLVKRDWRREFILLVLFFVVKNYRLVIIASQPSLIWKLSVIANH